MLLTLPAQTQTCSAGLGDPIVNITFGSGTGYGPALVSGITNMEYESWKCVLDNAYEIVNQVSGCYTNDWVTVVHDHTGDPNGYLMLIGAADEPSTFFLQKVDGLCGSTQYQFAAWVLNLASHLGEIEPNISFSIEKTDGTVLQSFTTGDIPINSSPTWNQYAFNFTTPPGINSVIPRMTNNAPGGYGNDLCLDDITFRTIGPKLVTSVKGYSGNKISICANGSLQLNSTVESCYTTTSYQWQQSTDGGATWSDISGAVNPAYTSAFPAKGTYLYRLAVAGNGNIGKLSCQVISEADSIEIDLSPDPTIAIAGPTRLCDGDPADFSATTTNQGAAPLFQWMRNDSPVGSSTPSFSYAKAANGDQVSCTLTSKEKCVSNPVINSNLVNITVSPLSTPTVHIDASANAVCADSLITFTARSSGANDPVYQWSVNGQTVKDTTSIFLTRDLNNGDVVSIIVNEESGCSVPGQSNAINMTIYELPAVYLPPDTVIAAHTSIVFAPEVSGPIQSYQWTPSSGLNSSDSPNPVASPVSNTMYQLLVTSPNGCTAFAKEEVDVFYDLTMPKAFTPNGDGVNDVFRVPPSIPATVDQFQIFNRWGQQVFACTGNQGWDGRLNGKDAPIDTYVWMIVYYNPILKKQETRKGTVILIR